MSVELESAKRLTTLKNKIDVVTKTPSNTLSESVDNVIAGYGQGGSGGGDSGVDLWAYIENAPIFSADIQEITEDITLHLERATGLGNLFDLKVLNMRKITVYLSDKCTNLYRAFGRAGGAIQIIEIIGDTSSVTRYGYTFAARPNLEQIIGVLDFTSATETGGTFVGCSSLREVRFNESTLSKSTSLESSPLLSDESIQSIIDGLADLTGQTAQTLTLHEDVVLTEEQKATITLKNWILVQ